MTTLSAKLREISIFIYTLIFLLIFNLFFNQNYNWYGISLIIRIYIFVFSFYLVFIFASLDISLLKKQYLEKFGKKGEVILFFETRIIPFLSIYLITVVYTFIEQIRDPNWPWHPTLSLLNGRYSNGIIYSWFLLIILKLKKKPGITIPLFIGSSIIYGVVDRIIFSTFDSGLAISAIKILKIIVFLFFLFGEFFNNLSLSAILSLILSMFFFLSTITTFSTLFKYSKSNSYRSKESGLILLKMGFTYPLEKFRELVIQTSDYNLFLKLLYLSKRYEIEIGYSEDEWEYLLLTGSIESADLISSYIMNKNVDLSYENIIFYAEEKSKDGSCSLLNAENFLKISSNHYRDNEKDFLKRLKKSNKCFKLWGIRILGENRSVESMPLLLSFITNYDESIASNAHNSLKLITGMDPAVALDKKKNNPDIITIFKKYYNLHSTIRRNTFFRN